MPWRKKCLLWLTIQEHKPPQREVSAAGAWSRQLCWHQRQGAKVMNVSAELGFSCLLSPGSQTRKCCQTQWLSRPITMNLHNVITHKPTQRLIIQMIWDFINLTFKINHYSSNYVITKWKEWRKGGREKERKGGQWVGGRAVGKEKGGTDRIHLNK